MFYHPKIFWKDRWILIPSLITAVCQAFSWIYFILHIRPSADQFLLHYNIIFGVDLVGAWYKLFFIPLGGLLTFLVNLGIAWFFYGDDKILARFLAFFATLINIFLALAAYLIIGLNI